MDESEADVLQAAQAEVQGDLERLEAYGSTLPEVWLQVIYDGPDLVALLTDPDAHRAELLALVEHPDRLTVRRAPYSRHHLEQVGGDVLTTIGRDSDRWRSAGPTLEGFHISLRSSESALAQVLHDRFGDVLKITLGQHRFPLPATTSAAIPPAPTSTVALPDLALRTALDQPSFKPGHEIHGQVHMRNTSTTRQVRVNTGSLAVGVVLWPDGTRAGAFNGGIAATGRVLDLDPGAEDTIGFIAGSDTINPTQGVALLPGEYLLVVPITIYGDGRKDSLLTPPVALSLRD